MKRVRTALVAFVPVLLAFAPSAPAQTQLVLPDGSPKATVTQKVGLSEFSVTYFRPAVNKRKVWGGLVPYGEVWRVGANDNTALTVSTPFTFGGKELPAGTYGVHALPTEGDWTMILSTQSKAWGSFTYDAKEDAARAQVKPVPSDFTERLSWSFDEPTADGAAFTLRWEKLKVSVPIGVDTKAVTLASIREQLRGLPRFSWQGWNGAAGWCMRNKTNLDEGIVWADRSIAMQANYQNLRTKAGLLELKGDAAGAAETLKRAQPLATEVDINLQGYTLLGEGKMDEAIAVFRKNAADHPKSWNVWDSLAEGLDKSGDRKGARENYEKALPMAPEDQKKRIAGEIAKLK